MNRQLTIVLKLGTSSIVDEKTHEPLLSILSLIVETAVKLQHAGHRVIIVSSGAIGLALRTKDLTDRPKELEKLQALAAVGQCKLMSLWNQLFSHFRQPVAQILLTRNDITNRTMFRNAQKTIFQLLSWAVIPIVNENDTLAVSEIKFGDNDTLSAITAGMVHADYLFLMTDVDCLYDKNPRVNPDAKAIQVVPSIDALQADVSSSGSNLGTGGMLTKIVAARRATSAGVTTIITKSNRPGNITNILEALESAASLTEDIEHAPLHTRFLPAHSRMEDTRFWLLNLISPRGSIYIDKEAHAGLISTANLFPSGIVHVQGTFAQQECVCVLVVRPAETSTTKPPNSPSDPFCSFALEVGRAIVNYSSAEIVKVKGLQPTDIVSVLGYADTDYVAHHENIALLDSQPSGGNTILTGTHGISHSIGLTNSN